MAKRKRVHQSSWKRWEERETQFLYSLHERYPDLGKKELARFVNYKFDNDRSDRSIDCALYQIRIGNIEKPQTVDVNVEELRGEIGDTGKARAKEKQNRGKKTVNYPWNVEQRELLNALAPRNDLTWNEKIEIINRKYQIDRTKSSYFTEWYNITHGKRPTLRKIEIDVDELKKYLTEKGTVENRKGNYFWRELLNALGPRDDLTWNEKTEILNRECRINKTCSAYMNEWSRINTGKKQKPKAIEINLEELRKVISPDARAERSEDGENGEERKSNFWSDAMKVRLYELKGQNYDSNDIAAAMAIEFRERFTRYSVNTIYSEMRKKSEKRPASLKDAKFPKMLGRFKERVNPKSIARAGTFYADSEIVRKLNEFDEKQLAPVLKKREEIIYNAIRSQAEEIRGYDVLLRHGKSRLQDIMALDESERKRVMEMLSQPTPQPQLTREQIEIVVQKGYGENISFMLPIFLEDSEIAESNLRSAIHDSTIGILMGKDSGLKRGEPFKTRFQDMTVYNFSMDNGEPNYKKLSESINKSLRKEYKGVNVQIVRSKSLFELAQEA